MQSTPPSGPRIRHILLARAGPEDQLATGIQLVLITAWHWSVLPASAALVDWLLGYGASSNGVAAPPRDFDIGRAFGFVTGPFASAALLTALLVEGVLAWGVFRFSVARQASHFALFVQAWWRVCLWGIAALPVAALLLAEVTRNYDVAMWLPVLWIGSAIIAPALVARAEATRASRRPRWSPVCPDCGYALRRLRADRCPECGVAFPLRRRRSWRWAFRRLPWERLSRGSLIPAYLKSLAWIVFAPAKAARGVAIPDRWKRGRRWALGHGGLAIAAGVLLGNDREYIYWLADSTFPPAFRPPSWFRLTPPPLDRVLLWAGQSGLAWAAMVLVIVAIACAISVLTPGRQRAARLAGVKWSLYLTPLLLITVAVWHLAYFLFPQQVWTVFGLPVSLPTPEMPGALMALPYGVWHAIGMGAIPFDRRRGFAAAARFGLAFFAAWLLVTQVLFPAGPLEALR